MKTRKGNAFAPDYAVHPGDYLDEILEARGLKKNELAEGLGISFEQLSLIIDKRAPMSAAIATQLERAFGISADIWNKLQADYELILERQKADIKFLRTGPLSS